MNTGVMVISCFFFCFFALFFFSKCSIQPERTENNIFALLSCPPQNPPAPLPHTHIQKNAVYKIFSYSQGALSRLLEASALIA